MSQRANRLRRKQGVSVERNYYFTFSVLQSDIECCRFASGRSWDQPDTLVTGEVFADDFARPIHRPIIHNYDLVVFIVRGQQTIDRILDHQFFVVSGHDYRDEGRVPFSRVYALPVTRT